METTTKHAINPDALRQFFGGTSKYYRHWIRLGDGEIVYTDGIRYLMVNGAGWLIDAIASYLPSMRRRIAQRANFLRKHDDLEKVVIRDVEHDLEIVESTLYRQRWKLIVDQEKSTAVLEVRPAPHMDPLVRQVIEYTDFPMSEIDVYVGGQPETDKEGYAIKDGGITFIIFLPTEKAYE